MSSITDAVNCPDCEDQKMGVMQGAPFIWQNFLCYWRRRKCPKCGHMHKTVEVPANALRDFHVNPESKDMI